MNVIRFDRHELFTDDWMSYHRDTLRSVEEFFLNIDETPFNQLTNMLCGIWDGYLYNEILETAKQFEVSPYIIQRIETIIEFIKSNLK